MTEPEQMSAAGDVIGVIGAGQIGRSVAHAFAERSAVVLVDRDEGILAEAVDSIRRAHLGRLLHKVSSVRPETILKNIEPTTELGALRAANFLIENITESPGEKLDLHQMLARLADPEAVIATNTSAIPLAYLASAHAGRADRFLGLHFMIPVIEIRYLELIRARETSPAAISAVRGMLERHDLRAVEVADGPGFVSNRLLMLLVNEAAAVVREGTAPAASVDAVLQNCMGHRLGPLATADLIGLDTVVRSLRVLQRFCDEMKFAPDPMLLELVKAGQLGRKTGSGFFDYTAGPLKAERKSAHAEIEEAPAE
jgi:3-hydroxybutyryl-CoA dehydrogenase